MDELSHIFNLSQEEKFKLWASAFPVAKKNIASEIILFDAVHGPHVLQAELSTGRIPIPIIPIE